MPTVGPRPTLTAVKKIASTIVGIAAVAALLALPAAPAHAAGKIKVDRDHVCVEVEKNGEVNLRYVLTRFVVTHLDEDGQAVGETESTAWKRWGRRDYRQKWERLCG